MAHAGASIRLKIIAEGTKAADHRELLARMLELAIGPPPSGTALPAGDPPVTACDQDPNCVFIRAGTDPDGSQWRMYMCGGVLVTYWL